MTRNVLDNIVEKRKIQLQKEISRKSLEDIMTEAYAFPNNIRNFYKALSGEGLSVIAEVKKASPSKGLICEDFDLLKIIADYGKAGADALSIVTEEYYFKGSYRYLRKARKETYLPILRKDFIIDPYQVYESRALGADAILLIAAILSDEQLEEFDQIASGVSESTELMEVTDEDGVTTEKEVLIEKSLGLSVVFEVHNKEELNRVLKLNPQFIGINNRDLTNFSVNLKNVEELIYDVPTDCIIISESGIVTNDDMRYVHSVGANAVLIGETLMRSDNIALTMTELRSGCGEKIVEKDYTLDIFN
jgi:indole-3-glycerol phosphate synthase